MKRSKKAMKTMKADLVAPVVKIGLGVAILATASYLKNRAVEKQRAKEMEEFVAYSMTLEKETSEAIKNAIKDATSTTKASEEAAAVANEAE